MSLSARRAWIEIIVIPPCAISRESLSARRAWIEIASVVASAVDFPGRSPQGERGLKSRRILLIIPDGEVALRKESVD